MNALIGRRVLEVRAAAEVGELVRAVVRLGVERDLALGGVDELDLVGLAFGREALVGLVAVDLLARPGRAPRR